MKANHALSVRIFNIKLKWMRRLKLEDQLYFDSRNTMRHLSIFNLNSKRKNRFYDSNMELENDLAIYLMMIMTMNSVTDHESSRKEFERFAYVPWYAYKLAQGINPYKLEQDPFADAKRIGIKRQLAEIYNKAWDVQEKTLKIEVSKEDFDMFGDIVDYYSHETVAFALIENRTPKAFDYEIELAGTFQYLTEKYYKNSTGKSEDEKKYQRIMKDYIERTKKKFKKVA